MQWSDVALELESARAENFTQMSREIVQDMTNDGETYRDTHK